MTVADYWQDLIDNDLVSTVPAVDRRVEQRLQLRRGLDLELRRLGCQLDRHAARPTRPASGRSRRPRSGRPATRPPATGAARRSPSSRAPSTSYEAAKFALWLNTSDEALTSLNETANHLPRDQGRARAAGAARRASSSTAARRSTTSSPRRPAQVNPDFVWGPTMTQTYADVSDGFKAAVSGDGTLADALDAGPGVDDRGPRGAVDPGREVSSIVRAADAGPRVGVRGAVACAAASRHGRSAPSPSSADGALYAGDTPGSRDIYGKSARA